MKTALAAKAWEVERKVKKEGDKAGVGIGQFLPFTLVLVG